jgi:hypothetical protein
MLGERTLRQREIWYDTRGGEVKIKHIGVSRAFSPSTSKVDLAQPETEERFWPQKTLSAKVLPPQPTLVLDGCSISDAGIMLLEGET